MYIFSSDLSSEPWTYRSNFLLYISSWKVHRHFKVNMFKQLLILSWPPLPRKPVLPWVFSVSNEQHSAVEACSWRASFTLPSFPTSIPSAAPVTCASKIYLWCALYSQSLQSLVGAGMSLYSWYCADLLLLLSPAVGMICCNRMICRNAH